MFPSATPIRAPGLNYLATVYNGIDVAMYPLQESGGDDLIPTDGSGWSTTDCPTYPTGVTMTLPAIVTANAFESTVCVEIWDNSTPQFKCFFTHDPDMDVTP